MLSLSDYLKQELHRPWEPDILKFLFSLMTEDEKAESKINPLWTDSNDSIIRGHQGDLFCAKGISALGISSPLMIEIKGGLLISIFERELNKGLQYLGMHPDYNYWVIYGKTNINIPENNINGVYFYSFDYILAKGEKTVERVDSERDFSLNQDEIIENAVNSLHNSNCTFILGAGVSVDAGSPTWDNLLKGLIGLSPSLTPVTGKDYDNINSRCGWSSLITARYIIDNKVSGDVITENMRKLIYVRGECDYKNKPTSLPIIADIAKDCNIESCITFNYDEFLEEALKDKKVVHTPFYDKGSITHGDLPIYHVHGLISRDPNRASSFPVLSEREYHLLYANDFHWSNVEILRSLIRNTCFLVGLSMYDPNLRRLLEIARFDDNGDARHFVFMRKEPLDCKNPNPEKDKVHWTNLERKYFELGLNIIWYDYDQNKPNDFTDLANKLNIIHRKFKEHHDLNK